MPTVHPHLIDRAAGPHALHPVVRIRYQEKRPEVEVTSRDGTSVGRGRTDPEVFLKSLPSGLADVYRPYLERRTDVSGIPTVQRTFGRGGRYCYHKDLTVEGVRTLLAATDALAQAIVGRGQSI